MMLSNVTKELGLQGGCDVKLDVVPIEKDSIGKDIRKQLRHGAPGFEGVHYSGVMWAEDF